MQSLFKKNRKQIEIFRKNSKFDIFYKKPEVDKLFGGFCGLKSSMNFIRYFEGYIIGCSVFPLLNGRYNLISLVNNARASRILSNFKQITLPILCMFSSKFFDVMKTCELKISAFIN